MKRTKAALAAAADSVWDIKMQTGKRFAAHATYLLVPSLYYIVSWGTTPATPANTAVNFVGIYF